MSFYLCFLFNNSVDFSQEVLPKSSAGEINIFTPENKTYTEPDNGYYPATFGFEEDRIGDEGLEIEFIDNYVATKDANIKIINELDGHKKIMDLWDGNQLNAVTEAWNNFSANLVTGIIEFWTQVSTVSFIQRMHWHVYGNNDDAIHLALNRDMGGTLYYTDGTYHPICTLTASAWYHFKISFDANSDWHLEVRDEHLDYVGGDGGLGYGYVNPTTYFNRMRITTSMGDSAFGFHMYLDAISYSWENYNVDDNLKEGLLLSYLNSTNLDWQAYSLDSKINKTILGDTTISFPADGNHVIQVFGNDTMGTIYSSNPRWFTIDAIHGMQILTPENQTYIHPDSGYYLNTYGFEGDEDGSNPDGWEITSGAGTGEVVSEMIEHSKVLDLYDTSSSLEIWGVQTWDQAQSYGTVELWFYMSDFSKRVTFYCIDTISNTGPVSLLWRGDLNVWKYAVGSTWYTYTGLPVPITGWNHLTIHFERTAGNYQGLSQNYWKAVLNDHAVSQRKLRYNFNPNQIRVASCSSHYNYHIYIDALGYSWDPNYSIGDNLNEGLLLNYDTTTALEWQGYSLDGAINRTIYGNTVIPFPADGHHHIQVFGNDSLRNSYESQLRYFSIDRTLPYISVLTPAQYSYFSRVAPYFQITTSGENLSSTFYQIGDVKFFCETNQGRINQAIWEQFAEGLLLITFYVNNTFGNYSMAQLVMYKDTISPYVAIRYYYEGRIYDTMAPHFYLDNYDVNLDLTWYTLNDDLTKHYFIGDNFRIGQVLWDNLDDGIVNITIYANDKAGNEDALIFYVIKDTSNVEPYYPPYYPPYLAIAIGGIMLLGIVVTIIVVIVNKKSQPQVRKRHYDQIRYYPQPAQSKQYRPQPVKPKQYENQGSNRLLKCPYCSNEEDIDGDFCPQCGARLK